MTEKAVARRNLNNPKRRPSQTGGGKATKAGNPDRRRAPETQARILDAAEALFANRGFYGASLRDIAKEAGAQLALINYHFGSKEDLFSAVIDRRAEENARDLDVALNAAVAQPGTLLEKRTAVLRAFVSPVVEKVLFRGPGWRNYIRLMGHTANMPQEERFMSPFRTHFDEVVGHYISALVDMHPEMDETSIHWCFFFYQAAITHVIIESEMLDRQSKGVLHIHDLEMVIDRMVPFFAAGFGAFSPP